jgi:hypothetical protein
MESETFTASTQAGAEAALSWWLKANPSVMVDKKSFRATMRAPKGPGAPKNDGDLESFSIIIEYVETSPAP